MEKSTVQMALKNGPPRPAIVRPTTDPKFGDFQINGAMKLGKEPWQSLSRKTPN